MSEQSMPLLLPQWAVSIDNPERMTTWLRYDKEYEEECRMRVLKSGRKLIVDRSSFGQARLGISCFPPLEKIGIFYDTWIFPNWQLATYALETWNPELVPEPTGWNRHHTSNRRRPDGDASQEYLWE